MRETTEAIVGAVTGPLSAPSGLLLGRYDDHGRLQYTGRTTTLARAASATVAGLLAPARRGHPWTNWSFSAGWGSRDTLNVTLVEPELVMEVGVDVARDASVRWRPHACTVPAPTAPPPTPPAGRCRRADARSRPAGCVSDRRGSRRPRASAP